MTCPPDASIILLSHLDGMSRAGVGYCGPHTGDSVLAGPARSLDEWTGMIELFLKHRQPAASAGLERLWLDLLRGVAWLLFGSRRGRSRLTVFPWKFRAPDVVRCGSAPGCCDSGAERLALQAVPRGRGSDPPWGRLS